MSWLIDTSVPVRWAEPGAPEHQLARKAVAALWRRQDAVFLTPQNLVEFWSVATRPASANGLGLTPVQAGQQVRRMEGLFTVLPENIAIFRWWRRLVVSAGVSGKQVHDARIAAVMRARAISHILTFNTEDFQRYPRVIAVHPRDL